MSRPDRPPTRHRRVALRTGTVLAACAALLLAPGATPVALAQPATVRVIVQLGPEADVDAEARTATAGGGRVLHRYRQVLRGFALEVPERALAGLQRNPRVRSVERDQPVRASEPTSLWGLDRIDQRALPLSGTYTAPGDGAGVSAYVLDTGILAGHTDFGGRVRSGYTAIADGRGTTDCNGHGTHVAGTVAGRTHGVAKAAVPVAVRVLDCAGSGTTSGVIAGLDWVAADHAAGRPAVANLSLGGPASSALDSAVTRLVADGVTVVLAAGNDAVDACTQSPARTAAALTVAASTRADARASFSNFGSCTDLFAPGDGIRSAWYTGTTATAVLSGTSMAAPHVAGAAAVLLGQQSGLAPADVADRLLGSATTGVVTGVGAGSPDRLLFVDAAVGVPLAVTAPGDQRATAGTATSLTVRATDGAPPYAWSATGLPAGLAIDRTTGTIAGTPSTAGTSTTTVTATDSAGRSASASFTWTVAAPACTAGQRLADPGFESGGTGWAATAGVVVRGDAVRPARTGAFLARLGGKGVPAATTLAQDVAIPAGCSTYRLSFWLRIDSAEISRYSVSDRLTVGLGGTTLATYTDLDRGAAYVQRSFDVSGRAGRTVTLTFRTTEDSGRQTSFVVDDTALAVG